MIIIRIIILWLIIIIIIILLLLLLILIIIIINIIIIKIIIIIYIDWLVQCTKALLTDNIFYHMIFSTDIFYTFLSLLIDEFAIKSNILILHRKTKLAFMKQTWKPNAWNKHKFKAIEAKRQNKPIKMNALPFCVKKQSFLNCNSCRQRLTTVPISYIYLVHFFHLASSRPPKSSGTILASHTNRISVPPKKPITTSGPPKLIY